MEEKLREHIEKRVPLTDDEFAFMLTHFTVQEYKKQQILIKEGQPVKHCYFVVSGLLRLVYTDRLEKEHIVSFAMEDWWECDFDAFFNQTKATLVVDCLENTVVYCLSLDNYNTLCAKLQKFERFFLKLAITHSFAARKRILSLMTDQAKERYELLLSQYPTLVQRVSKTLLASYLGVSRETLSRLSA